MSENHEREGNQMGRFSPCLARLQLIPRGASLRLNLFRATELQVYTLGCQGFRQDLRDLSRFCAVQEYVYHDHGTDDRMNVTRCRLSKPAPFQSSENEEGVPMAKSQDLVGPGTFQGVLSLERKSHSQRKINGAGCSSRITKLKSKMQNSKNLAYTLHLDISGSIFVLCLKNTQYLLEHANFLLPSA